MNKSCEIYLNWSDIKVKWSRPEISKQSRARVCHSTGIHLRRDVWSSHSTLCSQTPCLRRYRSSWPKSFLPGTSYYFNLRESRGFKVCQLIFENGIFRYVAHCLLKSIKHRSIICHNYFLNLFSCFLLFSEEAIIPDDHDEVDLQDFDPKVSFKESLESLLSWSGSESVIRFV